MAAEVWGWAEEEGWALVAPEEMGSGLEVVGWAAVEEREAVAEGAMGWDGAAAAGWG